MKVHSILDRPQQYLLEVSEVLVEAVRQPVLTFAVATPEQYQLDYGPGVKVDLSRSRKQGVFGDVGLRSFSCFGNYM